MAFRDESVVDEYHGNLVPDPYRCLVFHYTLPFFPIYLLVLIDWHLSGRPWWPPNQGESLLLQSLLSPSTLAWTFASNPGMGFYPKWKNWKIFQWKLHFSRCSQNQVTLPSPRRCSTSHPPSPPLPSPLFPNRLTEIYNFPKFSCSFKEGSFYYFHKNDGLQNQSVMYQMRSLDDQTPEVTTPLRLIFFWIDLLTTKKKKQKTKTSLRFVSVTFSLLGLLIQWG